MPQGMSPQQWFWMNLMSQMTGQPVPSFAEPTPVSGTDPVFDQYSGYTPPTDQRPSTIATGAGPPSPAAGGYPVYPDYTGMGYPGGPLDVTPASTGPQPVSLNYFPDGQGGYSSNPIWQNLPAGGLTSAQEVQVNPAAAPAETPAAGETGGVDIPPSTIQPGDAPGPPAGSNLIWSPTEQAWVPPTSPSLGASPAGDTGIPTGSAVPGAGLPPDDQAPLSNIPSMTWGVPGTPLYGPTTTTPTSTWTQPTNWQNIPAMIGNLGRGISNVAGDVALGVAGGIENLGNVVAGALDPGTGYYSPDYLSAMGYTGTDPSAAMEPPMSGIPIPDTASSGALAYGLGPLPGATVGGGGGVPNVGSSAAQMALFHNVWSGKAPLDYATWNSGAGTPESWASRPGGTYQNYLAIWNSLRSSPQTATRIAPGTGSGQTPGGAGRPTTSAT